MFDFKAARYHMVESQIRTSDVTDMRVLSAFRRVARENFVPKSRRALAYSDAHIAADAERSLMCPRDFSKMVQAAEIEPTDVILDIACGRGYSTAVLAMIGDTVVGLEESPEAVERATQNLADADISNAAIVDGNLKAGAPEHGPFDVIFVNGAVQDVPKTWLDQLSNGGRLVCVVTQGPVGHACVFTRVGDAVGERVVFDSHIPALAGFEKTPEFTF